MCGGAHLKRVMTCTDFYASGEQFELYSCEDCGFTFTQGVPVEAEIGKYYETPDYISHTDTRKGAMNNIYHYVRSYMLGRKARLVAKEAHRKTGRLLDIGTGTGYFSDTMVRRGWKVEAVEKSPQAREFAKLHFDLDVRPESTLKEFAPGSFDVITLWHVMVSTYPARTGGRQMTVGIIHDLTALSNLQFFGPALRWPRRAAYASASSTAEACQVRSYAFPGPDADSPASA